MGRKTISNFSQSLPLPVNISLSLSWCVTIGFWRHSEFILFKHSYQFFYPRLPISWFGILCSLANTFTAWLNLISADAILLFSKLIILDPTLMHYIIFAMFPQLSSFIVYFIVPYIYFGILLFMLVSVSKD